MTVRTILALLLTTTAAGAAGQLSVAEQAARCWNIPAGAEDVADMKAQFDVQVDGDGNVLDITVTQYADGDFGKKFVLSASKAIQLCAPYNDVKAGTEKVTMDAADLFTSAPEIDPFMD